MSTDHYDLAVSFAGEQRDYVEATVEACKALGLNVFYHKDRNNDWWGGSFIREQRQIYASQTRFFVPFISNEYLNKPIPMDEFESAMMTAVKQGNDYILPILMDDTQIPADLLHPHTHYLRASDYTPAQLAAQLAQRVGKARDDGEPATTIGPVVEKALAIRLPKIVPNEWSKYQELDKVFDHLTRRFQQGADQLTPQGLICTVRARDDALSVRVERLGTTVAGLDIEKGKQMGDDHITWSVGRHHSMSSGYNGWATPKFDKDRGLTIMDVSNLAAMGSGREPTDVSYDGFFDLLWGMVLQQVEQAH